MDFSLQLARGGLASKKLLAMDFRNRYGTAVTYDYGRRREGPQESVSIERHRHATVIPSTELKPG